MGGYRRVEQWRPPSMIEAMWKGRIPVQSRQ